jgi:uncharacterized Ntn-hydrolase superfamily protein
MRAGKTPEQAVAALVAADPLAASRQVAMLGPDGTVAVHTGADCIAAAGHRTGDGVAAQANCVESPRVWEAMTESFEAARGPLAERLLAALDAAEEAGGDWRGRQAAAIYVVPADGQPWDTVCDLRVDDHPEPLSELRRLLRLHGGYSAMGEVDDSAAIARAAEMEPLDVRFAEILDAARVADVERARELFAPLLAEDSRWREYFRALGDHGYLPHADRILGSDDVSASRG